MCLITLSLKKSANTQDMNCGWLSVVITQGLPSCAKIDDRKVSTDIVWDEGNFCTVVEYFFSAGISAGVGARKAKATMHFSFMKLSFVASSQCISACGLVLSSCCRGSTSVAQLEINLLNQEVKPRIQLSAGMSFGAAASAMAVNVLGCKPSVDRTWPRNVMWDWPNELLLELIWRPASFRELRMACRHWSCSSLEDPWTVIVQVILHS